MVVACRGILGPLLGDEQDRSRAVLLRPAHTSPQVFSTCRANGGLLVALWSGLPPGSTCYWLRSPGPRPPGAPAAALTSGNLDPPPSPPAACEVTLAGFPALVPLLFLSPAAAKCISTVSARLCTAENTARQTAAYPPASSEQWRVVFF